MTHVTELDTCLRAFIKEPDNFLISINFIHALHNQTVWASDKPYVITVGDDLVSPVFTSVDDLEKFKTMEATALEQIWLERTTLKVVEESIKNGFSGLVFNPKDDGDVANTTLFKSSELLQFLNYYTSLLNHLISEKNISAETMDKYYLVPAFIFPREDDGYDRMFPTMSTPEGKNYVPAFSTLDSFAKWYQHKDFGKPFREAKGVVLAWQLPTLYQPEHGENDIDETVGVAINPFDEQQILVDWSDIDE